MVAKTGKTFKLWSIQGSPDLFLLIIYDLSSIEEIQLSNDTKRKISLITQIIDEHPIRLVLSLLVVLLICLVLVYPLSAFQLCRYDILLGLCLLAMIVFVRDGVNYVMQEWFNSQQEAVLKQKRNDMSSVTLELLNSFRNSTDEYGRKVGKLFKQKVDWDQLSKGDDTHLNEIAKYNLYNDIYLVTTTGVWELSTKFQSYSRNLIDIFAETTIKQLIERDFTESEKKILSGRAGIMDVWIEDRDKNRWLSRSHASMNIGTFRYVSFGQNDYGLFWEEVMSSDKKFAGYLVLHNDTQKMLEIFIQSNSIDSRWRADGLGAILCDENDRILHQWGSINPEIESSFKMGQIDQLTKKDSNWIEIKLTHAAFGKKTFYVYADKSKSLDDLSKQRDRFTKSLNIACLISLFLMLCILFRVKQQIKTLLSGLKEVMNSKFGIQMKIFGWDESSQVIHSFNRISNQLLENQKLSPFVAREILVLFRDEKGSLQREITDEAVVLFSDIRSFTTLSEQQSPEEIVEMLNQYFEIWAEIVSQYGGIIERFIGDAIQVIFFESKVKNMHQTAIECAIKVRQKILNWNSKRRQSGHFEVSNGIGIATGTIRFTILGNRVKRHFVSQGKPVIHAEELEAISAYGKTTCIITDRRTTELLIDQYDFESWQYRSQTVYELKH